MAKGKTALKKPMTRKEMAEMLAVRIIERIAFRQTTTAEEFDAIVVAWEIIKARKSGAYYEANCIIDMCQRGAREQFYYLGSTPEMLERNDILYRDVKRFAAENGIDLSHSLKD